MRLEGAVLHIFPCHSHWLCEVGRQWQKSRVSETLYLDGVIDGRTACDLFLVRWMYMAFTLIGWVFCSANLATSCNSIRWISASARFSRGDDSSLAFFDAGRNGIIRSIFSTGVWARRWSNDWPVKPSYSRTIWMSFTEKGPSITHIKVPMAAQPCRWTAFNLLNQPRILPF